MSETITETITNENTIIEENSVFQTIPPEPAPLTTQPVTQTVEEAEKEELEDTSSESKKEEKKVKTNFEFDEDEMPSKRFLRAHKEEMHFMRDKWILSRINDEDLMEYLRMEQARNDQMTQVKESRNKRIYHTLLLTLILASVVAVVFLLKDNPTILINILYIVGLLVGFWLWKSNKDK